jgi:hypothetical protein
MLRDSEDEGAHHKMPPMYPSQHKSRTVTFSDDSRAHVGSGNHFYSTYPSQFKSRAVKDFSMKSLENVDAFVSKKNQLLGGFSAHKRLAFERSHAGKYDMLGSLRQHKIAILTLLSLTLLSPQKYLSRSMA